MREMGTNLFLPFFLRYNVKNGRKTPIPGGDKILSILLFFTSGRKKRAGTKGTKRGTNLSPARLIICRIVSYCA